jgi:predicted AAA+ superfamily ATPase
MQYIKRDLEEKIIETSKEYSCILVCGPRQAGKTTLLRHLDPGRAYVTLDFFAERKLARSDPATFLRVHRPPVLIDEIQYAPELLSYIKIAADSGASPGSFWLTASRSFRYMELEESLAGRAAILHVQPLSQHEIYGSGKASPFLAEPDALRLREAHDSAVGLPGVYERIWRGGMPGFVSGAYTDQARFYGSWEAAYINRDVSDMTDRLDKLRFHDFMRAAACRIGQRVNAHSIEADAGIADKTAKHWLHLLEASEVIFYLRPYPNKLLKRPARQPKLYFFDTGLAAFLTGHLTPEILGRGASNGAILENYAVSEIRKTFYNSAAPENLRYYRDRDGAEIDLLIEQNGAVSPIAITRSSHSGSEHVKAFEVLDRGTLKRGCGAVICTREQLTALDTENFAVPVWMI